MSVNIDQLTVIIGAVAVNTDEGMVTFQSLLLYKWTTANLIIHTI